MASYQVNPLEILDTTNAVGIGSGGSLTVGGGISIGRDTYIGGDIIISGTTASFADNIIILNAGGLNSGLDTGILLQRNINDISNGNNFSSIIYNEMLDEFQIGYVMSDTRGSISMNKFIPISVGGVNISNGCLNATFNSNTLGNIFTTGGNIGIGMINPGYQLELSMDSAAKPSTNTWTVSSDERLKTDIELANLDMCYNTIRSIPLKKYKWRDDVYSNDQVPDRSKLGWIAQDVEKIIPKAVDKRDMLGYSDCRTLNSDQIIANLYGCVQKLMDDTEILKDDIEILKNEISCMRNSQSSIQSSTLKLKTKSVALQRIRKN